MSFKAATSQSKLVTPAEASVVHQVRLERPKGFWKRWTNRVADAAGVVTKEEFLRIATAAHKELDGQAMHPWQAAKKAKGIIEGYTHAHCTVHVPKCDLTETAILVAYLGKPEADFFFSRSLKLKDPKGASRG